MGKKQNKTKYAISTTIYIKGDKPEYYLHGNRLQYLQSRTGSRQMWMWTVLKQRSGQRSASWIQNRQNNSTQVGFFCHIFPRQIQNVFQREILNGTTKKTGFLFFSEMPGVSASTDLLTWWVTVFSNSLEQISVHLLTHIHDSGKQEGSLSLYKASKGKRENRGSEDSGLNQLTVWRLGWVPLR